MLGISSGLPGPVGLHGTQASGVVASTELLGTQIQDPFTGEIVEGTELTGLIVAHEIGHYLGLFHTSDIGEEESEHDPLDDTPECTLDQFPIDCPDLGNLMFPAALPGNRGMTVDQAFVIRADPMTKE